MLDSGADIINNIDKDIDLLSISVELGSTIHALITLLSVIIGSFESKRFNRPVKNTFILF